jgi:hypothetical protein
MIWTRGERALLQDEYRRWQVQLVTRFPAECRAEGDVVIVSPQMTALLSHIQGLKHVDDSLL